MGLFQEMLFKQTNGKNYCFRKSGTILLGMHPDYIRKRYKHEFTHFRHLRGREPQIGPIA